MAFDPLVVRRELAAALATVPGLRVYDRRPPSPVTPAALVGWYDTINLRRTMGAINTAAMSTDVPVQVIVSRADDKGANDKLNELMVTVPAAIEVDKTLNGSVGSVHCVELRDIGPVITDDGSEFLGMTIVCRIIK